MEAITIYRYMGEDGDGRAAWDRLVLPRVAVFRRVAVGKGQGGMIRPGGQARCYVFGRDLPEGVTLDGLFRCIGRDRVVLGECGETQPPEGPEALRPIEVDVLEHGSGWVRHAKVVCA